MYTSTYLYDYPSLRYWSSGLRGLTWLHYRKLRYWRRGKLFVQMNRVVLTDLKVCSVAWTSELFTWLLLPSWQENARASRGSERTSKGDLSLVDFNVCRVPCSEVVQIGEICFCYIITKKYQTLSSKCGKMTQCNCMIKIAINYLTWTCRKVLWSPLQMLILLTHPICQSKIQKHISFLNVGTDKNKTDVRQPQVSEDRRVTGTLRSAWPASLILTIWPS